MTRHVRLLGLFALVALLVGAFAAGSSGEGNETNETASTAPENALGAILVPVAGGTGGALLYALAGAFRATAGSRESMDPRKMASTIGVGLVVGVVAFLTGLPLDGVDGAVAVGFAAVLVDNLRKGVSRRVYAPVPAAPTEPEPPSPPSPPKGS